MDDATITACLAQIRAGDDAGAQAVWDHFGKLMLADARAAIRYWAHDGAADEHDIVQNAFSAFWGRVRRGRYADLATVAALERVLRSSVLRTARNLIRDARRQKRGGGMIPAADE